MIPERPRQTRGAPAGGAKKSIGYNAELSFQGDFPVISGFPLRCKVGPNRGGRVQETWLAVELFRMHING